MARCESQDPEVRLAHGFLTPLSRMVLLIAFFRWQALSSLFVSFSLLMCWIMPLTKVWIIPKKQHRCMSWC